MIYIPLYAIASLYLLWVMYLAVMSLGRARNAGTLSRTALILGYPLFIFGSVFNILCNWILLTIIFLELPKETMFTSRVTRHCLGGSGWRKRIACWICHDLLDTFDPNGVHCK